MIDSNFYNKAGPFTIEQVAEKLNCDFSGNKDFKIFDISTLENAKENEISSLKEENRKLKEINNQQLTTIDVLNNSNQNLTNEVATLSEALGSTSEQLLESAASAQALAEEQIKLNQQVIANDGLKSKMFYRQSAANLETSATSSNNG